MEGVINYLFSSLPLKGVFYRSKRVTFICEMPTFKEEVTPTYTEINGQHILSSFTFSLPFTYLFRPLLRIALQEKFTDHTR